MMKFYELEDKKVEENGVLDDVTICLINESDATDLLSALKSEAAGYYRLIVSTKPHRAKFLKGWLNRAFDVLTPTKAR